MSTVRSRLVVAVSTFMFGLALDAFVNTSSLVENALFYPVKAVDSLVGPQINIPVRALPFDPNRPTEITFERIQGSCFGCAVKRIRLRTKGSGAEFEDATVTEIDLRTGEKRDGKLDSYYYRNLMRFIEAQGFFAMKDQYFTGTTQNSFVRSSVNVGDRYKSIVTAGDDQVPPALWGIHYAIEGVLQNVSWED